MADAGNRQPLLGGGGGKQRPGTAEQNPLQFSFVELIEKITAERHGTAAAAGAAGMNVLCLLVENHGATVGQLPTQSQSLPFAQLQQKLLADLSQIAGDDQIKVLRPGFQVLKMGPDGGICRRSCWPRRRLSLTRRRP